MTAPLRAADFVASIGVNVQLASVNGGARVAQTLAAFDYLGVSLVRSPLTASLLQQGSVRPLQTSPRAFRETWPPRPIITWSCTVTPSSRPASAMR